MQDQAGQQVGNGSNLPPIFTSLLGRELEVETACTLLCTDARILTLTGTGGIGKTRLAIQVATELRAAFADGICFVPLAPVSDPAQVIPAVVRALELRETFDCSPLEQLQEHLRNRHFLLLLDNFEQVLAAAPAFNDLLAGCPALHLLVTSREKLSLADEHVFSVQPLSVPDLATFPTDEDLADIASVSLFIRCAQMVQPGFRLTRTNARTVALICSRLDGLPLAIELAAARVTLLPPQALLRRLENSLSILTSNADSRPARHQTLQNTIQWSYDLLNAEEQQLFRRLALFVDGFTLHAAEALYTRLDGSNERVLDSLSSLIEKNLVRSPERDEEDPRLGMLETVRAFGLKTVEASAEYTAVKHAYMHYFLTLAEEASSHGSGPQGSEWHKCLERDLDNLRVTMQYALTYGKQTHNMELALRLGSALKNFWTAGGYFREGRAFLEQALATHEGESTIDALQVDGLLAAAQFALLACDYEQAQRMLTLCHTYYQERDETAQLAMITWRLGWLAQLQCHYAQVHVLYNEAMILSRKAHDEHMVDVVRYHLAYLALTEGDYQQSRVLMEESLAYRKTVNHALGIAAALGDMAQLLRISSLAPPVDEMQRLLDESIIYAREAGDRNVIMAIRFGMAWVAFLRGNLDEASQVVDETITFYKEAGKLQSLGHYLELLARISAARGQYAEARVTFEESAVLAKKQNDINTLSSGLVELAHLGVEQGQYARAARILGADEKIRETASVLTSPFDSLHRDHAMTIASAVLGRELFTLLWSEGRTLGLMEALAASDALPTTRKAASTRGIMYPAGLTRREVDVLRLVAQGLTDSQVAEQLVISTRTVTTHLTSIYNKLQINSRAAATNFAVKNHLA